MLSFYDIQCIFVLKYDSFDSKYSEVIAKTCFTVSEYLHNILTLFGMYVRMCFMKWTIKLELNSLFFVQKFNFSFSQIDRNFNHKLFYEHNTTTVNYTTT